MTPTFSNLSPSPCFAELNEDHQLSLSSIKFQASSSSSLSCNAFLDSTQDQCGNYHGQIIQQLQYQHEDETLALHGGSYDLENENNNGLKLSIWKKIDHANENQSEYTSLITKWKSSKIRLMKNSDQTGIEVPNITMDNENRSNSSSSHNSNFPVRVCSDCNTTKTPLWRGGPRGPKSLCNACGIRQRKARRAMAAAAAAAATNGTTLEIESTSTKKMKKVIKKKDRISNNGHVVKFKKRSKMPMSSSKSTKKKLCFEDLLVNLSKNLDFHRVFPQDEKEAAILLMALSCGLIHG